MPLLENDMDTVTLRGTIVGLSRGSHRQPPEVTILGYAGDQVSEYRTIKLQVEREVVERLNIGRDVIMRIDVVAPGASE